MNSQQILWRLITGEGEVELPTKSQDWERLARLAVGHGVAPLIYKGLQKAGLQAPEAANQLLKAAYYTSLGRAALLEAELSRLQGAFTQAGLAWLPLKGAALAWQVYPDPALRPMTDLDLLVQPEGLLLAIRAARGLGYRLDKLTYHAVLRGGPGYEVALELHWRLPGGKPCPPLAALSDQPSFTAFTYLYCAAHLAYQHAAQPRLLWRYDLRLLRQRLDNPNGLAALAALESQLDLALDLPALEDPAQPVTPLGTGHISDDVRSALRLLPLGTRTRLLGALLFPSREYMLWRYQPWPGWLWPAWYVKRMGEWVIGS